MHLACAEIHCGFRTSLWYQHRLLCVRTVPERFAVCFYDDHHADTDTHASATCVWLLPNWRPRRVHRQCRAIRLPTDRRRVYTGQLLPKWPMRCDLRRVSYERLLCSRQRRVPDTDPGSMRISGRHKYRSDMRRGTALRLKHHQHHNRGANTDTTACALLCAWQRRLFVSVKLPVLPAKWNPGRFPAWPVQGGFVCRWLLRSTIRMRGKYLPWIL